VAGVTDLLHPRLRTYPVCGVPIAALDASRAAAQIVDHAVAKESLQVHLCNAYTLSLVDFDDRMRAALLAGDLNLADGAPVAWLGRATGAVGPVRGAELVGEVWQQGGSRLRHYLYGGKDGVAAEMAAALRARTPDAVVAGTETPPFRPLTDADLDAIAARVRASGANILWIGLGTPRQDYLVHRLSESLPMPIVPVGAAFDFWSGAIKEAPKMLHGSGFEWLHRLASEPRRLWRRYLLGNPRFLLTAWRHRP
jgi:N-acetylglucosaminyldiphosphoundecaprenol N-acetyl-beta-D-mannosaminyltransferase